MALVWTWASTLGIQPANLQCHSEPGTDTSWADELSVCLFSACIELRESSDFWGVPCSSCYDTVLPHPLSQTHFSFSAPCPKAASFPADSYPLDHLSFLSPSTLPTTPIDHVGPAGQPVSLLSSSLIPCSESTAGHSVLLLSKLRGMICKAARCLACCLQVLQCPRLAGLSSVPPGLALGSTVQELCSPVYLCIDLLQPCIADL